MTTLRRPTREYRTKCFLRCGVWMKAAALLQDTCTTVQGYSLSPHTRAESSTWGRRGAKTALWWFLMWGQKTAACTCSGSSPTTWRPSYQDRKEWIYRSHITQKVRTVSYALDMQYFSSYCKKIKALKGGFLLRINILGSSNYFSENNS